VVAGGTLTRLLLTAHQMSCVISAIPTYTFRARPRNRRRAEPSSPPAATTSSRTLDACGLDVRQALRRRQEAAEGDAALPGPTANSLTWPSATEAVLRIRKIIQAVMGYEPLRFCLPAHANQLEADHIGAAARGMRTRPPRRLTPLRHARRRARRCRLLAARHYVSEEGAAGSTIGPSPRASTRGRTCYFPLSGSSIAPVFSARSELKRPGKDPPRKHRTGIAG